VVTEEQYCLWITDQVLLDHLPSPTQVPVALASCVYRFPSHLMGGQVKICSHTRRLTLVGVEKLVSVLCNCISTQEHIDFFL
jgi:hypothetical protein